MVDIGPGMGVAYCILQSQGHNYGVTGNVVVCSHSHRPSPHAVAALSAACIGVGYMYAGVTQTQRGWQDLVRPHKSSPQRAAQRQTHTDAL